MKPLFTVAEHMAMHHQMACLREDLWSLLGNLSKYPCSQAHKARMLSSDIQSRLKQLDQMLRDQAIEDGALQVVWKTPAEKSTEQAP